MEDLDKRVNVYLLRELNDKDERWIRALEKELNNVRNRLSKQKSLLSDLVGVEPQPAPNKENPLKQPNECLCDCKNPYCDWCREKADATDVYKNKLYKTMDVRKPRYVVDFV
jgi:hypothetical protein